VRKSLCLPLVVCLFCVALSAQQSDPARLPVVGDQPEVALPLATDLSPSLKPDDIKRAIRKVADWQVNRLQGQYTGDWTMSALYVGLLAALRNHWRHQVPRDGERCRLEARLEARAALQSRR
jgi:hypothetical protein